MIIIKRLIGIIIIVLGFLIPQFHAQSIFIGSGASIYVPSGADICAGEYGNISGNIYGEGTQCGNTISFVEEQEIDEIPTEYNLTQNYPNPFNPTTIIKYQIPELSFVIIKVFDVLGSEVATLINEEKPVGSYRVEFDATNLPSGVYFYRLQAGSFVETKKMILLK